MQTFRLMLQLDFPYEHDTSISVNTRGSISVNTRGSSNIRHINIPNDYMDLDSFLHQKKLEGSLPAYYDFKNVHGVMRWVYIPLTMMKKAAAGDGMVPASGASDSFFKYNEGFE